MYICCALPYRTECTAGTVSSMHRLYREREEALLWKTTQDVGGIDACR